MRSPTRLPLRIAFIAFALLGFTRSLTAWSPGTSDPTAIQGFVVDTANRTDVLAYYNTVYPASNNYPTDMNWTGNVASGVAGATSGTFQNDVLRRINFYRGLNSLPANLALSGTDSAQDQDAALMFAANSQISHHPPTSWTWFTLSGSEAASNSNIALGTYGPGSVDAFMQDTGANNFEVGHRRWLLYSREQIVGTGDIPPPQDSSYTYSANAIWVIGNFAPPPATSQFVEWPNAGYSPFPLMPQRWSLSYPSADFSNATVNMTQSGTSIPVSIVSNTDNGYGDNTIVWQPSVLPSSISADTTYQVTVAGIAGAGIPTSHAYSVTLFDPSVLGASVTITGTSTPDTAGAPYTFNSIYEADAYQLRVSAGSNAPWVEGTAESPPPQVQQMTTGTYALLQTSVFPPGATAAFHLAFPDFNDQSFEITRDIFPTAASQLQFSDLGRFATTNSTLSAQISTDSGNTWTTVWTRYGVGTSSNEWDPSFIGNTVSLSAYAGKIIRIQFLYSSNGGSAVIDTSTNSGFFISGITVTNALQLIDTTVTTLSGSATSFTLDAATAGAPLVSGAAYFMRIRPEVGTVWFGDGPPKIVTPQGPSGYALWIASQYPQVTGGPTASYADDGVSNGLKYAFGLNPTIPMGPAGIPTPALAAGHYAVTFTQPAGITGVVYGAQWSTDLANWTAIPDTGSGATHTFSVSTANQPRMFFRYQITVTP